MNTKKMRRTLERSAEIREAEERRRWLDRMTPEHRAKHEGRLAYGICSECFRISVERVGRALQAHKAPNA